MLRLHQRAPDPALREPVLRAWALSRSAAELPGGALRRPEPEGEGSRLCHPRPHASLIVQVNGLSSDGTPADVELLLMGPMTRSQSIPDPPMVYRVGLDLAPGFASQFTDEAEGPALVDARSSPARGAGWGRWARKVGWRERRRCAAPNYPVRALRLATAVAGPPEPQREGGHHGPRTSRSARKVGHHGDRTARSARKVGHHGDRTTRSARKIGHLGDRTTRSVRKSVATATVLPVPRRETATTARDLLGTVPPEATDRSAVARCPTAS